MMIRTYKLSILTGFFIILFSSIALATPGIPHQFYGSIYVNDILVPDNTVLTASIEGDNYSTITINGLYGEKPPALFFYVPDPEGTRKGKTIQFSVGGKTAGSHIFEDCKEFGNCYDEINFNLTTECGDGYCLGDETCESCSQDCGECPTEPLEIIIHSPENNKTYNNPNIPLEVSANQPMSIWMYSLNSADPIIFTPNRTIVADEGVNNLTVIGINSAYESESSTLSFSFELPPCGNGEKEWGEECDGSDFGGLTCSYCGKNSGSLSCSSECKIDCSGCYNSGGNGGDNGGNNGGSSGSGYTPPCTENWTCTDWSEECFDGVHTRNCTDLNDCGTIVHKPSEAQKCESVEGITYYCGDGLCSETENCSTCKVDCGSCTKIDEQAGSVCGNEVCEEGETYESCCSDCGCVQGYECKNDECVNTNTIFFATGRFLSSPLGIASIIGGILVLIAAILLYRKKSGSGEKSGKDLI